MRLIAATWTGSRPGFTPNSAAGYGCSPFQQLLSARAGPARSGHSGSGRGSSDESPVSPTPRRPLDPINGRSRPPSGLCLDRWDWEYSAGSRSSYLSMRSGTWLRLISKEGARGCPTPPPFPSPPRRHGGRQEGKGGGTIGSCLPGRWSS